MKISQLSNRITTFARTALTAAKQKNQKPETRNQNPTASHLPSAISHRPSSSAPVASILRPQARERWMLPQVGAITPQYIEMTLRGALAGAHIPQWELFNLMEDTWPRLRKNILELKMAVRNRRPVFEAYRDEDMEESPAATERMKLVSAALRKMQPDPTADEGGFDDMLFDILDAWFKGISVLEIDWHVTQTHRLGRFIAPRCTRWANPIHYAWDTDLRLGLAGLEDDRSQMANGRPRSQQSNLPSAISHRPSPLSPFPTDRFLVAKCKTKSGSILGGALLRPLVWWWCAANFSADWLLNLAQIFGLPFRWATYEPTAAQETVDRICAMLQNMGSAGWAAFPAGTSLELKADGQKSGAQTPQGDMLDRADKQCDLLVLGQTLTTDTGGMGSGGGSHALGQVHADVRSGIIDAAAKFTANVLEQQLIPAILRLNYGDTEEAPTLQLQAITEDNLHEKAAILAQLHATGAGSIIPLDWLGKTFGIPTGMIFQPSLSVTGTDAGDNITATAHGLLDGAALVFRSKTGGSSLSTNTIYYVVNADTDSFQLAAAPGGSALNLGSDVSAAILYRPGFLTGAATVPGVSDVRLKAINSEGAGAEVLFPIGIVAAAAVPDSNADLVWDFATNNIIAQTSSVLNLTPADRNTPILFVKEQDDLIIRLRLVKSTSVLDLGIADGDAKLVLKELEPEGKIVVSDASIKVGTGDSSSVLIHAKIDGDAIKAAFTNYEEDGGTLFAALAEIQISFDNPGYFAGDPAKLTRTSKTFRIQTERDLSEN